VRDAPVPYSWSRSAKTGVWLRAKETEISAAQWALRLGKDFTFTFLRFRAHCTHEKGLIAYL